MAIDNARAVESLLGVWVDPLGLGVGGLSSLRDHVIRHDTSVGLLHLAVLEDLLPSLELQLLGIHLLLFDLLLLFELLLTDLNRPLVHDICLLGFSLSLEVIGFDAVRSQHRHLRLLVLGHEIMVERVVDLDCFSLLVDLLSDDGTLDLLLSEDNVDVLRVNFVLLALGSMVDLGLLQLTVVAECHLILSFGQRLLCGFLVSLFLDLLLAPVLLLHLLHALAVAEALVLAVEHTESGDFLTN